MRFLTLLFCLFISTFTFAQKHLYIAFYNQEDLFDTIDDPHKNDNEFLPTAKNNWNTEKYLNKIDHMSTVIKSMNDDKGPDAIGMCEIENDLVLNDMIHSPKLSKMDYGFVHYESPDERSIDNALLYKKSVLKLIESKVYPVTIDTNPNFKTRDILLAKFETKNKSTFIILVNHFPSRLGGQAESEYKRCRAAEVLKHVFDSIKQSSPNQAVMAMGDFNDEPNNRSLDTVLGAKIVPGSSLFNAMYLMKLPGKGSLGYRGNWNMIDQLILNDNIAECKGNICYKAESAGIYNKPWLQETEEKYKGNPKRTFAGQKYLNGYSDHFPVYLLLEVKNKK